MLKVIALVVITSSTNLSFAQEVKESKKKKHAIGVEGVISVYYDSYGFNYRYYLNKTNLKAGVEVLSSNNYDFGDDKLDQYSLQHNQPPMISSIDSMGRFYGLDENYYRNENYIKLKLGAEKLFFTDDKINFLIGGDFYLGFYKRDLKSNANFYQLDSIENRSLDRKTGWEESDGNYNKYGKFLSEENVQTVKQNNVVLGFKFNTGFKINLSKSFFVITSVSLDFSKSISEDVQYILANSNYSSYLEKVPYYDVSPFGNVNWGASLGLNYRF